MVMIGVVSLWMPFMEDQFYLRWFTFPQIFYVAPVPILVALATFSLFQSLATGKEIRPFLSALAIFVLSFAGLGITFYPDIIPPHVTIWEAAAPESSLMFLLVGATVLIPLILAYTGYSYWVFRGKVREGEGYHH